MRDVSPHGAGRHGSDVAALPAKFRPWPAQTHRLDGGESNPRANSGRFRKSLISINNR
ncbi:MAG: hypothetical protein GMKNLPBB_03162 [Myxococcota bacterium]|nr:hypothetical protein [Myxococcota bacterium]